MKSFVWRREDTERDRERKEKAVTENKNWGVCAERETPEAWGHKDV